MMPLPSIYRFSNARHSCWLSAGTAQARIDSDQIADIDALRDQRFDRPVVCPMARRCERRWTQRENIGKFA